MNWVLNLRCVPCGGVQEETVVLRAAPLRVGPTVSSQLALAWFGPASGTRVQRLRPDSALGVPVTQDRPTLSQPQPSQQAASPPPPLPSPQTSPNALAISYPISRRRGGPQSVALAQGFAAPRRLRAGGWRGPFCFRARSPELCSTLSSPCGWGPALS